MKQEFNKKVSDFFKSKYSFEFNLSKAKLEKLWKDFKDGKDIDIELDKTLTYLKNRNNYPFYWYDNGFSIEESLKYSKEKGWHICVFCNSAFFVEKGYKACCSEECQIGSLKRRNKNLSISKLNYNSRDVNQYSKRHNISIFESKKIIDTFVFEGSNRRKEYWIKRGYSEEEAIEKISNRQSSQSPRCKEYWIKKGYSEEDAIFEVSKLQKTYKNVFMEKYSSEERKEMSPRCKEYWIKKGYSEEDAIEILSNNARKATLIYVNSTTIEERKENNAFCIEFYKKRFPDNYVEIYEESLSNTRFCQSTSKISNSFFEILSGYFPNNRIYFNNKEFAKYVSKEVGVYKYDYVDTTLNICVEFHGDYWHANPEKYSENDIIKFPGKKLKLVKDIWERDKLKREFMESKGFKFYTIWESSFRKDKNLPKKLYEEIINEN